MPAFWLEKTEADYTCQRVGGGASWRGDEWEKKRRGKWRTELIEMKGILSHFDLLPGVILSYRFLFCFFSPAPPFPQLSTAPAPGAREANQAPPKPLVVD